MRIQVFDEEIKSLNRRGCDAVNSGAVTDDQAFADPSMVDSRFSSAWQVGPTQRPVMHTFKTRRAAQNAAMREARAWAKAWNEKVQECQ